MFTEHIKKYSYGHKIKHNIATFLASDLTAQTSSTSTTDQNTTSFMLFRPTKTGKKHSYKK